MLQTHARLTKLPIDELDWQFEVLKQETPEELDEDFSVEHGVVILSCIVYWGHVETFFV